MVSDRLGGGSPVAIGRAMKALARIIAWLAVAAAIVCWQNRPTGFAARWVSMPAALPLEMFNAARKAAERPTYTPHCKWPRCRLS